MSKQQVATLPNSLSRARKRLEQWRSRNRPRARLPEELWSVAVDMAQDHGLNRTARALRLDYYALKKRLDGPGRAQVVKGKAGREFIELLPAEISNPRPECTLDFEDGKGAKMRIHLKGFGIPDLPGCLMAFGAGGTCRRLPRGKA